MSSRTFARTAAPAAFLLGVTIVVLLVRAGLEHRPAPRPATTAAATTAPTRPAHPKRRRRAVPAAGTRYVTVKQGDTFYSIAAAAGIDVPRLEALNPGVSPYSIHAGERIRVK